MVVIVVAGFQYTFNLCLLAILVTARSKKFNVLFYSVSSVRFILGLWFVCAGVIFVLFACFLCMEIVCHPYIDTNIRYCVDASSTTVSTIHNSNNPIKHKHAANDFMLNGLRHIPTDTIK